MFFKKKRLERENAELRNQVDLLKTIDTFRTRFETLAELEAAREELHKAQIKNLEERLAYTDEQLNKAIANEDSRAEEIGELLYGEDVWRNCKASIPGERPVEALLLAVRCDNGGKTVRFVEAKHAIRLVEDMPEKRERLFTAMVPEN